MVDGEADIVAGHAVAMERRRRRLAEAAGLDPGHKRQAEFILDFQYWRADRWGVESRWKPHVAKDSVSVRTWVPHPYYLDCKTECIARNACQVLRRQFPGKSYRFRPVRWVDAKGNRFPSTS